MTKATRKNYKAMPARIIVSNVGQTMAIWHSARLHLIYKDMMKVRDDIRARYGATSEQRKLALQDADAKAFFDKGATEWDKCGDRYRQVLREYQEEVDLQVPLEYCELKRQLSSLEVDVAAIAEDEADPRQARALQLAAHAGVQMAEIAAATAARVQHSTGLSHRERFLGFERQFTKVAREAMQVREDLREGVAIELANSGHASRPDDIQVKSHCTTVNNVACCTWEPSLRP